jgi:hypothetical protein
MDSTLTTALGISAILLPLVVGRLAWKRFDHCFGCNDKAYMGSLQYFFKKLGLTILITFILLWIGISLIFSSNPNYA